MSFEIHKIQEIQPFKLKIFKTPKSSNKNNLLFSEKLGNRSRLRARELATSSRTRIQGVKTVPQPVLSRSVTFKKSSKTSNPVNFTEKTVAKLPTKELKRMPKRRIHYVKILQQSGVFKERKKFKIVRSSKLTLWSSNNRQTGLKSNEQSPMSTR